MSSPLVKTIADDNDIPTIQPEDKDQILALLQQYGDFDAAVVVAYGLILPKAVIDYFPLGMINVHGSLLPRWRGPSPIEAAILNGDEKTGVSLMQISPSMDTGDVYISEAVSIDDATKPGLYQELSNLGAKVLSDNLEAILNQEIKPQPQDESLATYSQMIKKADGEIDWKKSAIDISREVRAYLGWPGSRVCINNNDVIITSVTVIEASGKPGSHFINENGDLIVYCGKNSLIINSIKPVGRQEISGQQFVRGYLQR